jgi:hypothetical protein
MEFCTKCGSLKINGSCTNKKCDHHIKSLVELATPQQIEYIKELAEQLADDITEINFDSMSKADAVDLIDDYLEKLDDTEKKLIPNADLLEDDNVVSDDDDE